ncbi:tyrosine-type DNA invertase [Hafnia paralvei]|uniref:DNA recombinase n=1 Tax=Hafnia paralvei TaxID=546367 RepID=A0A4Q9ESR0_9GAMM|nr:tyrosine-type DNA invertase [Hafnia paralvei]TBM28332.1 DNA recombinase [Hafnia paralvei]
MGVRKYLTKNEIDKLICISRFEHHSERNACIIKMSFIHGLRVSELCSLRLEDIDLDSKTIYIYRLKGGLSTIHPLTDEELPYIQAWLKVRDQLKEADSPWLFPSRKGNPFCRQSIFNMLKKYGKLAKISTAPHPHMLRHACGFALADLGTSTRIIQDYLGHRNIQHTVIYTASNATRFLNIWER